MTRDMDLIRDILLAVEAAETPSSSALALSMSIVENDRMKSLIYQLDMLINQVEFVSAVDTSNHLEKSWIGLAITWKGHEFLDNIRDSEVWSKTKAGAAKVGGLSLELLGALAKGFIKTKVEKITGVALDI
jgi:Hypothetical protein (DUF2513)